MTKTKTPDTRVGSNRSLP